MCTTDAGLSIIFHSYVYAIGIQSESLKPALIQDFKICAYVFQPTPCINFPLVDLVIIIVESYQVINIP